MINWLKKNKNRLSLRGIEKELGIPETTLSQVTRENNPIPLPKKWVGPLGALAFHMAQDFVAESASGKFEIVIDRIYERPIDQNISDYPEEITGAPDDVIEIPEKKAASLNPFKIDPLHKYVKPEKKELSTDAIKKMVDENKSKKPRRF